MLHESIPLSSDPAVRQFAVGMIRQILDALSPDSKNSNALTAFSIVNLMNQTGMTFVRESLFRQMLITFDRWLEFYLAVQESPDGLRTVSIKPYAAAIKASQDLLVSIGYTNENREKIKGEQ